jgi:uncharacterized protein (DUF952 family)
MILHIVARADWNSALARGIYAPPSLGIEADGFIHCSTTAQILGTANRFYRGRTGLVILCIDESRLEAAPKYEPPDPALGETTANLFPHLYRALNLDAVVSVIDLPCRADGTFELPAALR